MDDQALAARLDGCERQIHSLRRALAATSSLVALGGVLALTGFSRSGGAAAAIGADSLRVHELIVVDSAGVVRTRIGGNLPSAQRGDNAAGILVYDRNGRERGGYVTFERSGVVALTLDNVGKQAALFAAGPKDGSGATARLWQEGDWAEMKVDEAGPHFAAGRNGAVAFFMPEMTKTDAAALCTDLKTEVGQIKPALPVSAVLKACRAHARDGICRKCLGVR